MAGARHGSLSRNAARCGTVGIVQRALGLAGLLAVLVGAVAGRGAVIAAASSEFPRSVYPPPVRSAPGAAFRSCPSPSGLERFNATSQKLAEHIAMRYGHLNVATDLHHSDRSFWPMLRGYWRTTTHGTWLSALQVVSGAELGGPNMQWSEVMGRYCGSKLLTDSLNVVVTVRHLKHCDDCNGVDELFIDRRGVPLVYMVH